MKDKSYNKSRAESLGIVPSSLYFRLLWTCQNEMWKVWNSAYCLQGWDNCMPWVRSLVEVSLGTTGTIAKQLIALSLVSVREPFQPTRTSVKTWFSFSLYGVKWAEALSSWNPASSYCIWPLLTDIFREFVNPTLKGFSFSVPYDFKWKGDPTWVTLRVIKALALWLFFCLYFLSLALTL